MDKPGNRHIDYDLLGKYISGNATKSEGQEVEAWLEASEANQEELEALKAIWQNAPDQEVAESQVDVDAAWNKLYQHMKASGSSQKESNRTIKFRAILFRAAAILVIAAGIWGAFYLINSQGGPGTVMVASRDEVKEISLPDGSVVTLNKYSFLSYPEQFQDSTRQVQLTGEGYFSVNGDPNKPFIVNTGGAKVRVLGTEFNVHSFDDSQRVDVNVIEGKVLLYKEDNEGYVADSVRLSKGQKGVFYQNEQKLIATKADPAAIYWKSKTLIFERTELKKVFDVLDNIFDVNISTQSESIHRCRLSATFRNENIDTILGVIANTFELKIEQDKKQFKITGQGCQ